jgi:hypothetical protein
MAYTRYQIQEHLNNLKQAYDEAFTEGDWDRMNYIGLCVDDTADQLASFDQVKETK